MFGTEGALSYEGDDQQPASGCLELRRRDGRRVGCDGFQFENYEQAGNGPESLHAFIEACLGMEPYVGADASVGLQVVRTLDAMYRSSVSGQCEALK